MPNYHEILKEYQRKVFCGTYSKEGNIFLSACQGKLSNNIQFICTGKKGMSKSFLSLLQTIKYLMGSNVKILT